MKSGTMSARLHGGYKVSKYPDEPRHYSPNRTRRSPETPRRIITQAERNENNANKEEARVRANWNAMERAITAEKVRLAAEAKRIAAAIKKQKERNNRLAAAAAANLNNAKNLNKVFKNNKTLLGRLRARLRR
jgi:hypothetical protein